MSGTNNSERLYTRGYGGKLVGEVVYIYAFDLAYDMKRERFERLLGERVSEYSVGPSKRNPKQMFFYRPQMVNLPVMKKAFQGRDFDVRGSVKIFSVGAMSISVRVPFELSRLDELVSYHDITFSDGSLESSVMSLAESVRKELLDYCIRPAAQLSQVEAYTVFCLYNVPEEEKGGPVAAAGWLEANRHNVVALLTQEEGCEKLSEQEAKESTEHYVTYYENDLIVVDWDAALVINEPEALNDVLHIMELANVQLVELGAYDRILDNSLEAAYRDLGQRRARGRGEVHRRLREIRIDMARLNDELVNITKFFGDWYLANIYQHLFARFHLADWSRVINDKHRTLGELYQLLQQDWVNFWMMLLEGTIVLLFVIDLILLLATL